MSEFIIQLFVTLAAVTIACVVLYVNAGSAEALRRMQDKHLRDRSINEGEIIFRVDAVGTDQVVVSVHLKVEGSHLEILEGEALGVGDGIVLNDFLLMNSKHNQASSPA